MRVHSLWSVMALLLFVPVATAGTEQRPELVDREGDAPEPINDISAAWVNWHPDYLNITLRMAADLPTEPCPDTFPRWFVLLDFEVLDADGFYIEPDNDSYRVRVDAHCLDSPVAEYEFEFNKHARGAGFNTFNATFPLNGTIDGGHLSFRPDWSLFGSNGTKPFQVRMTDALSRMYYGLILIPNNIISQDVAPDSGTPRLYRHVVRLIGEHTNNRTVLEEGGAEDNVTLVLGRKPESVVRVFVLSLEPGQVKVVQAVYEFTPDDWDIPQSVDLVAQDDDLEEGTHHSGVMACVDDGSSSKEYRGLPGQLFRLSILDNDRESRPLPQGANGTVETLTCSDDVRRSLLRAIHRPPHEELRFDDARAADSSTPAIGFAGIAVLVSACALLIGRRR